MSKLDSSKFIFEIYVDGKYIDTVPTGERHARLKQAINDGDISADFAPGDIEFRLVDTGQ